MCCMCLVYVFSDGFIHIRFIIAVLHLLVMWVLNCSELSRVPSRYLTLSLLVIVSSMTLMFFALHLYNSC